MLKFADMHSGPTPDVKIGVGMARVRKPTEGTEVTFTKTTAYGEEYTRAGVVGPLLSRQFVVYVHGTDELPYFVFYDDDWEAI